ncbi:retrovirus-related pol polyprotein from transposon TNT 1-94 [Tanacetum coccineum]
MAVSEHFLHMKPSIDFEEFVNVFVRISFGSTIKLVSFDKKLDGRQFLDFVVDYFFDRKELFCFVDEVSDSEYVQVQDLTTRKVTGLDRLKGGMYHLINIPADKGDCITTATYLINRIPSYVIGNKTPYEVPLKKKPVYDHLRVFGCLAVVSNPSRTTDKFDPRGVPCDPVSFKEAVLDQEWCVAMDLELKALDDNGTWELTTLHVGKKVIGSYWIYKTKLKADGNVERKKARLVVNAKLDVFKIAFFMDLMEEVYIKPPLGYIGKRQKVSTVKSLDLTMLLSQFMQSPTSVYMQEVKHVLRLGKLSNDKKINNWILHSFGRFSNQLEVKKQVVVSRSLVEAEYRAMALTCYEVTWFVSLLKDLGIKNLELVDLFCGNQAALYIAANPIFHARTKHIEVDYHYVRDQLKTGIIKPSYVHTKSQLVDVFTKVVSIDQHTKLLSRLGVSKAIILQL